MRELLSQKELADALGRHRSYIAAMRRAGFEMIGGRATLAQALQFLRSHPTPRRRRR